MRTRVAPVVWVIAAACHQDAPAVAATCPDPAWHAARSADGGVALCLPPRFRATGPRPRWWRGAPTDSDFASLSVDVLDSAAAAAEWGTPPRPRRFRDPVDTTQLHAVRAESVVRHVTPVNGRGVLVETARLSGGIGLHRQPALRAVWPLPDGRWVLAQGIASRPGDLELLRSVLRTVRPSATTASTGRAAR